MIPLASVIRSIGPHVATQRQINDAARAGLQAGAMLYMSTYWPLRFLPDGAARYHFHKRTNKYDARKVRMQRAGLIVGPQPTPFLFRGDLKESLLTKPASSYRVQATATSARANVKIRIPFPHPMRPHTAAELKKRLAIEEAAVANEAGRAFLDHLNQQHPKQP